jgi:tetratricopeptide (TPR) repeat protein
MPKNRGRKIAALTLVLGLSLWGLSAGALEFSIRPRGFGFIPAGERAENFSPGGGGGAGFDFDISSIISNPLGIGYTAGIEGAFHYAPLRENAQGNLQLYSAGGGLGLYGFPWSRLFLRAEGALGVYAGVSPNSSSSSLWLRGGGETGFRFTPWFILSANGGYGYYKNRYGGTLQSGAYLGITAQFNFETRSSRRGIDLLIIQNEPAYPLFLSLYQQNEAGRISIRNHENAEIRDVRISFRAGGYTSSEFICGTVPFIARGRQAELPLLADFSPELLKFTEDGRILGEVIIRYKFLGSNRETMRAAPVLIHNRNVFPQADSTALAAYVSPTAAEVLEYAKYITGMSRSARRTGLNQNMQAGIWLFEGLRAYGLDLLPGNSSFPENRSSNSIPRTEIQFPSQTLVYQSGTQADLALLYAAALEAAGIPAAIIPPRGFPAEYAQEAAFAPAPFLAAFNLGIDEEAAKELFNGLDKLLISEGEIWLPLSMNHCDQGFIAAWEAAVQSLNRMAEAGTKIEFVSLEKAWARYPPAPFPDLGLRITLPPQTVVQNYAEGALKNYISRELEPKIAPLLGELRGGPIGRVYNQLGILYIRAGRMDEAKRACEQGAGLGSVPAMLNRGNIALLEKDYAAAERWFSRALEAGPDNDRARRGLEQARAKQ